MRVGYTTSGFAHHRLEDALPILAELGYRSLALTLERSHLDPPDRAGVENCLARLTPLLEATPLDVTLETGARFILDPRRKHQPTLLSAEPRQRQQRIEFLQAAVDVAAAVNAESVSLWSGAPDDDAPPEVQLQRLTDALKEVLDHANACHVHLSFEPEPGMFIDTMARYADLMAAIDHPALGLTLDIGHLYCSGEAEAMPELIHRWRHKLWNVHLEDMKHGRHEHLMFGEGDVDFDAFFRALRAIDYTGPVHVELSRHAHDAVETARRAMTFLAPYIRSASP